MNEQYKLELINLNVTSLCPFHCTSCFKSISDPISIEINKAAQLIQEASFLGVQCINIMGGEPLLYDNILEIIKVCSKYNLMSHIATSGYGLTKTVVKNVFDCGLNNIFISLNASTKEINEKTRAGFEYAVNALELASKVCPENVIVLWVLTSSNAANFEDFLQFLQAMSVSRLCILKFKTYPNYNTDLLPDSNDIAYVAKCIKKYNKSFAFYLDSCFPDLFIQLNHKCNKQNPCIAGINSCSINADLTFSPCTHISCAESFSSIADYWQHSDILKNIRSKRHINYCGS